MVADGRCHESLIDVYDHAEKPWSNDRPGGALKASHSFDVMVAHWATDARTLLFLVRVHSCWLGRKPCNRQAVVLRALPREQCCLVRRSLAPRIRKTGRQYQKNMLRLLFVVGCFNLILGMDDEMRGFLVAGLLCISASLLGLRRLGSFWPALFPLRYARPNRWIWRLVLSSMVHHKSGPKCLPVVRWQDRHLLAARLIVAQIIRRQVDFCVRCRVASVRRSRIEINLMFPFVFC